MEYKLIRLLLIFVLLLMTQFVESKEYGYNYKLKIAVLDTGYAIGAKANSLDRWKAKCIKKGYDATEDNNVFVDNHGHGTSMISTILSHLNSENVDDYCVYVFKFNGKLIKEYQAALTELVRMNKNEKFDVVNLSIEGDKFNLTECLLIEQLYKDNPKISVITAAGNSSRNIKDIPNYPAMCDDRNVIVGALNREGYQRSEKSNYGPNMPNFVFERGEGILTVNNTGGFVYRSGTSLATALYSAKIGVIIYKNKTKGDKK